MVSYYYLVTDLILLHMASCNCLLIYFSWFSLTAWYLQAVSSNRIQECWKTVFRGISIHQGIGDVCQVEVHSSIRVESCSVILVISECEQDGWDFGFPVLWFSLSLE